MMRLEGWSDKAFLGLVWFLEWFVLFECLALLSDRYGAVNYR
jgi:hypothetical protein